MTWPVPWVIQDSPQIDNPNASLGSRIGIVPANSADPYALLYQLTTDPVNNSTPKRQFVQPLVIPIPYPYDNAGVDFPAGSLMVISGIDRPNFQRMQYLRGGGGTGTISVFTLGKHLFPLRIRVWGLALGATGTVLVRHNAGYTSGAPTVTDYTFSFDGANGTDQVALLTTPISAPAAFTTGFQCFWTIVDSWVYYGRIVPDTLPASFTARDDHDLNRGGYWGTTYRGYAAFTPYRAMACHPSNWRFLVDDSLAVGVPITVGKNVSTDIESFRLGSPEAYINNGGPSPDTIFYPNIWIGDLLYQHAYMGFACGPFVTSSAPALLSGGDNTAGAKTYTQTAPFATVYGPGWRNIRCHLQTAFSTNNFGRPITLDDITAQVYVDGVLFTSQAYTGPFTLDAYFDIVDVLPASAEAMAKCEVKFLVHFTMGAGGGGTSGTFSGFIDVHFSPRCDIPLPFTSVGPTNEVAPGGYLPAFLNTPLYQGEPTIHNGVGVTSCVFAMINANTNVFASFAGTFLPPTTGVWKIVTTPGFSVTLGEFEFRINPRSSAIGRAGKRFWGHDPRRAGTTTTTWTLTAVTQVQTDIPSAGMTINSGHLTDGNWFFGTMTLLSAGTYRLTAPCAAGSGLLLALSRTDPYVADHLAGPYSILDGLSSGSHTTITVDITVTAPATIYVRFGMYDPYAASTFGDSPLSGAGGATGFISWVQI